MDDPFSQYKTSVKPAQSTPLQPFNPIAPAQSVANDAIQWVGSGIKAGADAVGGAFQSASKALIDTTNHLSQYDSMLFKPSALTQGLGEVANFGGNLIQNVGNAAGGAVQGLGNTLAGIEGFVNNEVDTGVTNPWQVTKDLLFDGEKNYNIHKGLSDTVGSAMGLVPSFALAGSAIQSAPQYIQNAATGLMDASHAVVDTTGSAALNAGSYLTGGVIPSADSPQGQLFRQDFWNGVQLKAVGNPKGVASKMIDLPVRAALLPLKAAEKLSKGTISQLTGLTPQTQSTIFENNKFMKDTNFTEQSYLSTVASQIQKRLDDLSDTGKGYDAIKGQKQVLLKIPENFILNQLKDNFGIHLDENGKVTSNINSDVVLNAKDHTALQELIDYSREVDGGNLNPKQFLNLREKIAKVAKYEEGKNVGDLESINRMLRSKLNEYRHDDLINLDTKYAPEVQMLNDAKAFILDKKGNIKNNAESFLNNIGNRSKTIQFNKLSKVVPELRAMSDAINAKRNIEQAATSHGSVGTYGRMLGVGAAGMATGPLGAAASWVASNPHVAAAGIKGLGKISQAFPHPFKKMKENIQGFTDTMGRMNPKDSLSKAFNEYDASMRPPVKSEPIVNSQSTGFPQLQSPLQQKLLGAPSTVYAKGPAIRMREKTPNANLTDVPQINPNGKSFTQGKSLPEALKPKILPKKKVTTNENPIINEKTGETLNDAIQKLRNNGWEEKAITKYRNAILGKGKDKIKKISNEKVLDSLNPTGGLYVDYTPNERATLKLGGNLTTFDKTSGKSPNDIVTVYRGAPKNQKSIVPGDFITTNYDLAKSYAGEGNVLSKKVKASEILDDANESLGEEYIYRPRSKNATTVKTASEILGKEFTPVIDESLTSIEKIQSRKSQEYANANYPAIREKYLAKNGVPDENGGYKSITINTDEFRDYLNDGPDKKAYTGTNAHVGHEAASLLSNALYKEALVMQQGKGNKTILTLAGGGGSGKGSASKRFINQSEYPLVLDQVFGNYEKGMNKLRDAEKNYGYKKAIVFVHRDPTDAFLNGVVPRAIKLGEMGELPRTVNLNLSSGDNLNSRDAIMKALKNDPDAEMGIIVNESGDPMFNTIIRDRKQAQAFLESKVYDKVSLQKNLYEALKKMYIEQKIPDNIALGLGLKASDLRRPIKPKLKF